MNFSFKKLKETFLKENIFSIVASLTVFVSVLFGYENNIYEFFAYSLFLLFCVNRKVIDNPLYWLGFIALFAPIIIFGWQFVGNQKFIHFYLLIFLFLGTLYPLYKEKILYYGSFFIIFLIFLGASIWKLSLYDFRSGNFLEFAFLSGNIFDFYAAVIESGSFKPHNWNIAYEQILIPNREAIYTLQNNIFESDVALKASDNIVLFSKFATILLLVKQSGVVISALLYLKTRKHIFIVIMHMLICEFIIIAYYPTQVIGFGILLCIIGIANAHFTAPKYKTVYFLLIGLLLIYDLPLHQWLLKSEVTYMTGF